MLPINILTFWSSIVLVFYSIPTVFSVTATYSSELTTNHPTWSALSDPSQVFYYEVFQLSVTNNMNDRATITSAANVCGFVYAAQFDPVQPRLKLRNSNCDGAGNNPFSFTETIQRSRVTTVVVSTRRSYETTSFTIQVESMINKIDIKKLTVVTPPPPTTTTTTTTTTTAYCYKPEIELFPEGTSINLPVQYQRLQDFYISSDIHITCVVSPLYHTQWKIYNCSSSCSQMPIEINPLITTKYSEVFVPAKTLDYGMYRFDLTVTMNYSSNYSNTESMYVKITSTITANLVQYGTSVITTGYTKNLTLNPGKYSIDPDAETFKLHEWDYMYLCRPYDTYNLIDNIELKPIDESDQKCFSNRSNNGFLFQYNNSSGSLQSSVTILAGSLAPDQTYQFRVMMTHHRNSSFQVGGFLTVKVEHTNPPLIVIGCVISTMCSPNLDYQYVNPSTQLALFSSCIDNCTSLKNITWIIYQGLMNSSTKNVEWTRFSRMNTSHDQFFGINTSNFTATSKLFMDNRNIMYWRFEALYIFDLEISSSAANFQINQPPEGDSCTIFPLQGTTSTIFNIYCSNWHDTDRIQEYSAYAWTTDFSTRIMLAATAAPRFKLRLPAGDSNISLVNILVEIKDTLNCVTQQRLTTPVIVTANKDEIERLVNDLQQPITEDNDINKIFGLPDDSGQNMIEQVLKSFLQEINEMNNHNLEIAVANGIPVVNISISPLGSINKQNSYTSTNASVLANFNQQLSKYANIRENLLAIIINRLYMNSDVLKMQASTLAKLTEATNQLTRETCIIASTECHNLSRILLSMATKISKEDVELAATHIVECATNVLSAINGPLQKRGNVLDLDFNRTNTFPIDYDTDLEFEWANENLFADGDDFSWETIQNGRYNYYQKKMANIIVYQVIEIFSSITAALNVHLNLGQNMTINTSSVFFSIEALSMVSLRNKVIELVDSAQIHFPSNFSLTINDSEKILVRSIMQPLAPFGNSRSNANTDLSTLISLSLLDKNGNDLLINTSINEPIELIIPRDSNIIDSSVNWEYVLSPNRTYQSFNLHSVNILRNNKLHVSVHFEIRPVNKTLAYWFIYKFDGAPQVDASINLNNEWILFCPENLTKDGFYRYLIDNRKISNHQFVVFGLRELNETEILHFCPNVPMNSSLPIIFDESFNFSSDYEVRTYTSGCYYLDKNNMWQSDGLIVGSLTNLHQTQCFSTHLTTFAGGFFPLPVTVNWNYVFANADFMQNKTIYLTIICVCTCYLILIIFARDQDKMDMEKLGITFLPDNRKVDRYFYQINIFTGHRKDAGTESKIHFVLGGDDDETTVRTLTDPHRKILQRNGIDAFITAVPKSLGPLNYLHIWHDNSGRDTSASWFLKYIIVLDLQTMIKTHFICQRWFAVEKDDGAIERLLPVAGEYQKQQLAYVLSKQAYHSMSEGHLWFSIFSRPPTSKFTRVQRCTCCFVLLFTTMFFNILYYGQSEASKTVNSNTGLSLGPFYFSREEAGTGIVSELLSFLASLLLVQLFRRTRQRNPSQQKVSPIYEGMMETKGNTSLNISQNKQKRPKLTFPWWCIFLAYILSILLVGLSILFIIARGIELGDLKTQKWLTSVVIGFVSSMCFTQPLKVLCLVILFAVFIRKFNDDEEIEDTNQPDLIDGEEESHHIRAKRLTKYEVEEARRRRKKEIQMWSIIREILSYVCFLWIVYAVAYSNRNNNAFLQVNHLRHFFLNSRHSQYDYTKIVSIKEYWDWLENSFVSNIRAQQWYNKEAPKKLKGFINDKSNRFIGWPTMRQLRIKSESYLKQSSIRHLNMTYKSDYNLFNEEQRSFQPGWIHQTTNNYSSSIHNAYLYKSSKQLDTYIYAGNHKTYGSGGYVYEFRGRLSDLRSNLSKLHQLGWIDDKTRAVIIQCTLYNPNAQLFTSVTLLIELLSTGGIIPTSRFEPINFQNFTSLFQLIIFILYIAFIIYFMMVEIRSLFHLKLAYFCQFWCYIEWSIIGCSWAGVEIYLWRYREITRISSLFREHKGYVYVNLQLATYINDLFTSLLGFCCFFGTIKLLRLCRYNRRLSLFVDIFRHAGKDLLLFTMTFAIVFMAFLVLFYLLFTSNIWACSTLLRTAEMLFEMILFKFDASELHEANSFLGPFYFTLFIFFVVFIGMTMFISIISDSSRIVRKKSKVTYNEDHEMLAFIWNKFLRWTGIRKSDEWELQEERDKRMRSEYHHPMESLPEKVERFLEAMKKIKIMEQAEISRKETVDSAKLIHRRHLKTTPEI